MTAEAVNLRARVGRPQPDRRVERSRGAAAAIRAEDPRGHGPGVSLERDGSPRGRVDDDRPALVRAGDRLVHIVAPANATREDPRPVRGPGDEPHPARRVRHRIPRRGGELRPRPPRRDAGRHVGDEGAVGGTPKHAAAVANGGLGQAAVAGQRPPPLLPGRRIGQQVIDEEVFVAQKGHGGDGGGILRDRLERLARVDIANVEP